jgi:hypothetical protein
MDLDILPTDSPGATNHMHTCTCITCRLATPDAHRSVATPHAVSCRFHAFEYIEMGLGLGCQDFE